MELRQMTETTLRTPPFAFADQMLNSYVEGEGLLGYVGTNRTAGDPSNRDMGELAAAVPRSAGSHRNAGRQPTSSSSDSQEKLPGGLFRGLGSRVSRSSKKEAGVKDPGLRGRAGRTPRHPLGKPEKAEKPRSSGW